MAGGTLLFEIAISGMNGKKIKAMTLWEADGLSAQRGRYCSSLPGSG